MVRSRSPRKSISSLFPELDLGVSSSGNAPRQLSTTGLRGTFSKGWPAWSSLRSDPRQESQPLNFTIKMSADYENYDKTQDAATMFSTILEMTGEIKALVAGVDKDEMTTAMEKAIEQKMSEAIFGSNRIEKAGEGFDETIKICLQIFRGQMLGAYDERPIDYEAKLQQIVRNSLPPGQREERNLRSRRETIQHAMAFQHMVDVIVRKHRKFTEQIFLETHEALCKDVDSASGHSSKRYAGRYRTEQAFAGVTKFKKASMVPGAMKSFVNQLNNAIVEAEKSTEIDPFMLAARFCDLFVNIHPFADGNGRMCRILLNTILLKFAGVVVVLGEQDQARDEYLGIAMRSSQNGGWPRELGTLVLKEAKRSMREVLVTLKQEAKKKVS